MIAPTRYRGRAGETKYVDGYLDYTTLTPLATNDQTWAGCEINPRNQGGVYGCLPVPKEGTGYSNRDGKKIFVKKIIISGTLYWSSADTVTSSKVQGFCRLAVVQDKRCPGTEAQAEDILGPGTGGDDMASLSADSPVTVQTNPNGWDRFKILKDKYFKAPPQMYFQDGVDGARVGYQMPFKMTVKVNQNQTFKNSTAAVASIVDNSFGLIGAQSDADVTVSVSYTARTVFSG